MQHKTMSWYLSLSEQQIIAERISYNHETVERVNANLSCYRWAIRDFSKIPRETKSYRLSPVFNSIDSKVKWCLKLYHNGTKEEPDFLFLAIYYNSSIDLTATFELSVMNIDNEVLKAFKMEKEIKLEADPNADIFYLAESQFKFARRSEIEDSNNRILADSCLTISCDVNFHDPICAHSIINDRDTLKNERLIEFDDFEKLLEEGLFSDFTFNVGGKEIHVHKAILATRSPVLRAMFQYDMQKTQEDIVDIDYAVLMELFRFMYTGTVHHMEELACDLLMAAEKYCVLRLKPLCEYSLSESLKIDNALEYLIIADKCNAVNLKKRTLEFIVKHGSLVVERDEFVSLHPSLMCEVTRALYRK